MGDLQAIVMFTSLAVALRTVPRAMRTRARRRAQTQCEPDVPVPTKAQYPGCNRVNRGTF